MDINVFQVELQLSRVTRQEWVTRRTCESRVDNNVPDRVDRKVTEKCNFSYILHWNSEFQRDVVLEIDFVRFRL